VVSSMRVIVHTRNDRYVPVSGHKCLTCDRKKEKRLLYVREACCRCKLLTTDEKVSVKLSYAVKFDTTKIDNLDW